MKKDKEYTTLEKAFLEHLFGEAQGDIKKAMKLAGYGDNVSKAQIMKQLREEIIELSQNFLAGHAPKAVLAMLGIIDDPDALGAKNKLSAAKEILDRAGLVKPESNVDLKIPAGGVIILPAKGNRIIKEEEE